MSDVNKDSAGDVAYLRDTIKAVAWDEWTEAGARAFLRDVHRFLPDLLRVVEAVASIEPQAVIGGKMVCFYCDEVLASMGMHEAGRLGKHDDDCAWVLARKLTGGTP